MKRAGIVLIGLLFFLLTGCGSLPKTVQEDTAAWKKDSRNISAELVLSHSLELVYATEFGVDYYENGCSLISISDGSRFLLVPEGQNAPKDLPEDIVTLKEPVSDIYLVASAVMDMFCSMDGLEDIALSGTKAEDWYIEAARKAMAEGKIKYAGKYNAPDYEQILEQACELSIQSTMIYHSPEVKEKLESFHIPVLVDYSSYEQHPLGRCEWIKLYGTLTGRMEEAQAAFLEQENAFKKVRADVEGAEQETEKTVAFFYITSSGMVNVRKTENYVSKMIELAGGSYLFDDLGRGENDASSVNMQMEEFYAKARDADYLIYNSSVDGRVASVEELLQKSPLLKEFKAVQEKNVWCTTQNMYQSSMEIGTMILDIHKMLTEDTEDEAPAFLYRLE